MPTARKATQLDERLHRDRQHQAVLVLGGVDVARAEGDGEAGQDQRDEEREVAEDRAARTATVAGLDGVEQRGERGRRSP